MLTLLPKEVRNVDPACHSDAMDCTICALVVQAGVGTRPGPASRSAAGARQTDCDGSVASARGRAGAALSEVSPGAESARWSSVAVARVLLALVVETFVA